jgi:type I restriction enzyme, S subunit
MSAALEAMARALFNDWVVDFGPSRSKMEGREAYLAPELWSLFSAEFNNEGIPKGWRRGRLQEIATSPSRTVAPQDVAPSTPYIALEHMPRRSIALGEWAGAEKATTTKSEFKSGEFLFGKLRPYFHKVGVAVVDGICSTDIVVVAPRHPHWSAMTLACISSDDFVEHSNLSSTGTKMPRTSWPIMRSYELALPPSHVAEAFETLCQPMIQRIVANVLESRTLGALRDLLLPKLMSGEISVIASDVDEIR